MRDFHISRAHRGGDSNEEEPNKEQLHQKKQGPKPIYAQFVNWRVAKEIRNKIIYLNSKKQTKLICNQMFSKELTISPNRALQYRRDALNTSPDLQIRLEYPVILKSRKKGTNGKWNVIQEF